MNSSDVAFEGFLLFVWLLIGFALLSSLGAAAEWLYAIYQRHRRDRREVLPDPHPRTVVRRRGWQVPM